jgi:hypothetical protein
MESGKPLLTLNNHHLGGARALPLLMEGDTRDDNLPPMEPGFGFRVFLAFLVFVEIFDSLCSFS